MPTGILSEPTRHTMTARFHLAFAVNDLDQARLFYGAILGCSEGRSNTRWIDFNLHGHQIVAHLQPGEQATLFLRDPSGNALEFKAFADESQIFAH